MKDFMQQDSQFERFLQSMLKDQFHSFQKILYFCRNVLSHHITADIVLTREDYEKQMLMLQYTKNLEFEMNYKDIFGTVRKGKDNYGFKISIDTSYITEGRKYTDIIPWHEQRMLAELCYNFSEYYKAAKLSKATPLKAEKPVKPVKTPRPRKPHATKSRHTS